MGVHSGEVPAVWLSDKKPGRLQSVPSLQVQYKYNSSTICPPMLQSVPVLVPMLVLMQAQKLLPNWQPIFTMHVYSCQASCPCPCTSESPSLCSCATAVDAAYTIASAIVTTLSILVPEQHKVLQRSSAAASWARVLWAERGCCTQIRRAIGCLREQEPARGSQIEQESSILSMPQHCFVAKQLNTTLFCRKTLKYRTFCRETLKYGTFCREMLKYALWAEKMA